jgi:hypothetical protein
MKTLLDFKPLFDPTNKTLDFSLLSDFSVSKLFAVVNITRNTPIYVPGTTDYGISDVDGSIITLSYDTSLHSASDILNVYYDSNSVNHNLALEDGGNLQTITETLQAILTELQVHSIILLDHLHRNSLTANDLQKIREDINNIDVTSND